MTICPTFVPDQSSSIREESEVSGKLLPWLCAVQCLDWCSILIFFFLCRYVLVSLKHSIAFFHSILDPHRHWQQAFTWYSTDTRTSPRVKSSRQVYGGLTAPPPLSFPRHHFAVEPHRLTIVSAPSGVVSLFTAIFNQHWDISETCQEEWSNVQLEVVHMMGAILCSSEVSLHCPLTVGQYKPLLPFPLPSLPGECV